MVTKNRIKQLLDLMDFTAICVYEFTYLATGEALSASDFYAACHWSLFVSKKIYTGTI